MTNFEKGQRVRIPGRGLPEWVTVSAAIPGEAGKTTLFVEVSEGVHQPVEVSEVEAAAIGTLEQDGSADSARVLAGMWTRWMAAASANAETTVLASTTLRPYAHQSNAVYGAMLPQPRLRFLLADEPGTGKTIMAGLYLREMQKLGFVNRALVVCPAGLVTKWQTDFERFFGGELRRITNETIQQHGLAAPHDMWVVSLRTRCHEPRRAGGHPPRQGGLGCRRLRRGAQPHSHRRNLSSSWAAARQEHPARSADDGNAAPGLGVVVPTPPAPR